MDKNDELQKKARPDQMAIKGTRKPDITTEPVAPAKALPGDRESFSPKDALDLKLGDRGPAGPDDD